MGLAAGVAPGPLLMLVISETTKGNRLNGILIAVSPLITDLPIVLVAIYASNLLVDLDTFYGILTILGGMFLFYLGIQNLMRRDHNEAAVQNYAGSLKVGIITNLLSPHPYIFWFTIGGPLFVKAAKSAPVNSVIFITGFYLLLVGSKIAAALLTENAKGFIRSSFYHRVIKVLGFILITMAVFIIDQGLSYL